MRFLPSRSLKVPVTQTIQRDCSINGTVQFKGGLLIEGSVAGDLDGKGTKPCITVGKHGSLSTSVVRADTLIVNGVLRADTIKARQVVLGAGSNVRVSSLQGDLVEIHTGAKFEGSVAIRGETPAQLSTPAQGTAGVAKERLLKKPVVFSADTPMTQGS